METFSYLNWLIIMGSLSYLWDAFDLHHKLFSYIPYPKLTKMVLIHKWFKSIIINPAKICPKKTNKPETNKNHNLLKLYIYLVKSDINPVLIRPMLENIDISVTWKFWIFWISGIFSWGSNDEKDSLSINNEFVELYKVT